MSLRIAISFDLFLSLERAFIFCQNPSFVDTKLTFFYWLQNSRLVWRKLCRFSLLGRILEQLLLSFHLSFWSRYLSSSQIIQQRLFSEYFTQMTLIFRELGTNSWFLFHVQISLWISLLVIKYWLCSRWSGFFSLSWNFAVFYASMCYSWKIKNIEQFSSLDKESFLLTFATLLCL
jgi:hypothetical protein